MRIKLSYANVMATLAMFGVLAGGGAYAASQIGTKEIANGAITSKKIRSKAVQASKVAPGAISTEKLDQLAEGVALAGARLDRSGQVTAWFNRLGDGPPEVTMPQVGIYYLEFPGLAGYSRKFLGQVTINGDTGSSAQGQPGFANTFMSGNGGGCCVNQPIVNTFDSAGQPANLGFDYVMFGADPFPASVARRSSGR